MNRSMIITTLYFSLLVMFLPQIEGQVNATLEVFLDLGKKIELIQTKYGAEHSLVITNKDGQIRKSFVIENEYDPCRFSEIYRGERNFAIISGRYRFYILNVNSEKLIGPIQNEPRIEGEDAQTGVLYSYQILMDGQYLLVNALDNGLSCFSLLDLYHPAELPFLKADSTFHKGLYLFIDKRKENIFNIISGSCANYQKHIDSSIIAQGYRFQRNSDGSLKYKLQPDNTVILTEIQRDNSSRQFRIDLISGEVIPDT